MPVDRHAITADDAPAAIGPYSHAVASAGLLFCSGQVALDPATGELVGDTVAEQAERCMANLEAVCAAAGARLADAVRCTVWLADMADFAAVGEVYGRAFPIEPPSRVAVQAAALPKGALVEIDAIVALDR